MELGDAADGHEEEGFAPWVPGEISRPQLAGWMHKKETDLELALATMVEHYSDGASSPEMSKATGKQRRRKKARTTVAQVIKDGQEAQGSHGRAISLVSATPRWPRA